MSQQTRVDTLRLAEDVSVDLRCSVLIFRGSKILLLGRVDPHGAAGSADGTEAEPDVWVLPGGRPHAGESLASCARREAFEETGLRIAVSRCQFVLEVSEVGRERVIDLVFSTTNSDLLQEPVRREPHLLPRYLEVGSLRRLKLHPPIAGFLRAAGPTRDSGAAYLGNLWRPTDDERE